MRLKTQSGIEVIKSPKGTVSVRTPQGVEFTDISEHDAASVGARTSRIKNPDVATNAFASGLVDLAMNKLRRQS